MRMTAPRLTVRMSALAMLATMAIPAAAFAQNGADGGEWRVYGGGPGHTRYSGLDQIDASNIADLEIAWRWNARNYGPNPFVRSSTTPLMVNGVLYATAGMRRSAVAIDPGTGETLWTWRMDEGERLTRSPRPNPGRGVAFWSDGAGDDRILVVTPGYHLVALDAKTGLPVDGFGTDGIVDLYDGHRTRDGIPLVGTIGQSSPPTVVGDVIVVGSAHRIGLRPPSMVNTPGDVRGFDARTGKQLWTFRTIPEAGELGGDTWMSDSWSYTGNAGVWAPISFDAETGYVYLPTEAATGDFYGGHRPGINLFSTSLVCLDSRTGERVWHFQTIHHDIWDWDNPTFPILADLVIDGEERKIVAQLTKQGFTFVFDRITGEPYVGSQTDVSVLAMVEGGDRSDMNYIRGSGQAQIARGVPIVKPPWGRITALDLTDGTLAWTVVTGDTPPRIAERLGLDPADLPRTGSVSRPGVLVTKTLLLAGEGASGAAVFRAHDKATGETIAEIELPNAQIGLPMTYMHEGRQYIVISVGGGGEPAELVALALPADHQ